MAVHVNLVGKPVFSCLSVDLSLSLCWRIQTKAPKHLSFSCLPSPGGAVAFSSVPTLGLNLPWKPVHMAHTPGAAGAKGTVSLPLPLHNGLFQKPHLTGVITGVSLTEKTGLLCWFNWNWVNFFMQLETLLFHRQHGHCLDLAWE